MSKSNPMHHKSIYKEYDCYFCGEPVSMDQNNEDEKGNQCYFGDNRAGKSIITCPKHYILN